MAGARGIRAGRAYVELFADDSKLVRGLRRAQQKLRAFGQSITGIGAKLLGAGAAFATPFIAAIKAASAFEETMNKFNVVFGDAAGEVKKWGDGLAEQVGRSKRQIAGFLASSQDLLVPIGFDFGTATAASKQLAKLAIDLASFNNMADADVLRDLQAALTGSGEVMKKYGVLVSEAAVKQELLNNSIDPKTATEQQKVMSRLQIIMRGTTAAQGDAVRSAGSFANQMKSLKAKVEDAAVTIGSALLPVVTPFVTKAAEVVQKIGAWIGQNQGLVKTLFKVVAIVAIVGAALIALGTGISLLGTILGGVGTVLTTVGSVLGFLVSPVGLVIAAVTALGVVFAKTTNIGGQVVSFLVEKFNKLKDEVLAVFGGIRDAMMAGDMKLAAKILWLSLQVAWKQGIGFLEKTWIEFKRSFTSVAAEAVRAVMDIFNLSVTDLVDTWSALEKAWVEVTSFMGDAWNVFTAGLMKGWSTAQNFIAKGIVKLMGQFDDTIDVDAAIADLDQQGTAKNRKIDADRDRKIGEREQKRQERLADIEAGRQGKRNALEGFLDDGNRNAVFDQQLADVNGELTAAQAELKAAIAEAANKRATKGTEKEGETEEAAKNGLPSFEGVGTGLGKSKASTLGTFNAAGVRGFSQGSAADRTAKATEETAKQTKKLVDQSKLGKLAFA
jgi:hypothetical protein